MGAYESHDLAPVRNDERKELNLSKKMTYKQYWKHMSGEIQDGCLTEIPWNIRDSVCLYEKMNISFNAICHIPPELPLRLPHLNFLDVSHNRLETLPESFGLLFHLKTLILRHNSLTILPESFLHLVKLEKVDLSDNFLRDLPDDLGKMEALSKINISNNKLKVIPVSLGNCPTLNVILAFGNKMQDPFQYICDEGSESIIRYLRKKFKTGALTMEKLPSTNGNEFPRIRGNKLTSSVPNPHSAHMEYIQSQTHTTNMPSRIKTPLMPPLGSTTLDTDVLKDRIIGLIYGAAVGDAIGLATRGMSPDHAMFNYDRENIQYADIVVDEHRVRWRTGDWSSNFDLFAIVLDSIISWAGVVDELDFAKRLQFWCQKGFPELGDSEGIILSQTIQLVTSHREFTEHPHTVAQQFSRGDPNSIHQNLEQKRGSFSDGGEKRRVLGRSDSTSSLSCGGCDVIGLDNGAVVRAAILGVPAFYDLDEVAHNTMRICKATHADPLCVAACTTVASVIALLLEGKMDISTYEAKEELINTAVQQGSNLLSGTNLTEFLQYCNAQSLDRVNLTEMGRMGYTLKPLGAAFVTFKTQEDFKSSIMKIVMTTGDANSNACVTGAIMGCATGYKNLPQDWIQGLRKKQKMWLNIKINLLLDMLGLP